MSFDRDKLKHSLAALAECGVFLGTSSWKYPGWRGKVYDESRYVWRGRYSAARFERLCLSEYAEVFKTVCVDAAYYKYPDAHQLEDLVGQTPADFRFTLKVTDEITLKHFPDLPRFGPRAGKPNPHFLDAGRFASAFLAPCETVRERVGLLIFEFSHFSADDFSRGRDFVATLDGFLDRLPPGWAYAVEIRNRTFLHPDYFAMLARRCVAHVFNSWADMPPVGEQLAMPGSQTHPTLLAARFLLKPGRSYEESVRLFQPYTEVKEPYAEGRAAATQLIQRALAASGTRAFVHVGNRFEGCSPETIAALLDEVAA
jgi:uncharacterized protein YecE (DUF72 family)